MPPLFLELASKTRCGATLLQKSSWNDGLLPILDRAISTGFWPVAPVRCQLIKRTACYNLPKQTEWEKFTDTLPDEKMAAHWQFRFVHLFLLMAWFAVAAALYSIVHIPIRDIGKWVFTASAFTAWMGIGIGLLTGRIAFVVIAALGGAAFGAMFAILALQ
jgi:hypothetical protein